VRVLHTFERPKGNGLVGFNYTVNEIIDSIASLHKMSISSWRGDIGRRCEPLWILQSGCPY